MVVPWGHLLGAARPTSRCSRGGRRRCALATSRLSAMALGPNYLFPLRGPYGTRHKMNSTRAAGSVQVTLNALLEYAQRADSKTSLILTRLRAVACTLNRMDVAKWCDLELHGYFHENPVKTIEDKVPDYRTIACLYKDPFGREIHLPDQVRDAGAQLAVLHHPLAELEEYGGSKSPMLSMRDYSKIELFQSIGISVADCQVSTLILRSVVELIRVRALQFVYELDAEASGSPGAEGPVETILRLFDGIRLAARPLAKRRPGKPVFRLDDEYDVQDLLHALMTPWFSEIAPEEWTPSYAAGSKRMDFLVAAERIAIEMKFVHDGKRAKKIADEIVVDIEYYAQHQTVDTLIALVFDPLLLVAQRSAVERALSGSRVIGTKSLQMFCRVRPNI